MEKGCDKPSEEYIMEHIIDHVSRVLPFKKKLRLNIFIGCVVQSTLALSGQSPEMDEKLVSSIDSTLEKFV